MLNLNEEPASVAELVPAGKVDSVAAPAVTYSTRRAWYSLVIFEIQIVAAGMDLGIVTLLVHPIETAFRTNDVAFAAITMVPVAIGTTVAYYPAGLIADNFRRRDVIAAGSLIWALAALLAARSDSGAMLFLARLLAGVGVGITAPATFSMLSDAFPRNRRAFALSIYNAGYAIGSGVGVSICAALVATAQRNGMLRISGILLAPWQQCFVAIAAMGIVALALVLTLPEPPRTDRSMSTNTSFTSTLHLFGRYLWRHRLLWSLLLIGSSAGATSAWAIYFWGPAFGMRHYGIAVSSMALFGTLGAGGALLGSVVGGILAQSSINHGNPRVLPRMLVVVSVVCCVFASGFPYMPSWLFAVIGMSIVGATFSALGVLMSIGIQETAPNEARGQLSGLSGFIGFLPQIVGSSLVALLASSIFAKAGGLGPALAAVGGIMGFLGVLLFTFSSGPYERAIDEMRALRALSQTGGP